MTRPRRSSGCPPVELPLPTPRRHAWPRRATAAPSPPAGNGASPQQGRSRLPLPDTAQGMPNKPGGASAGPSRSPALQRTTPETPSGKGCVSPASPPSSAQPQNGDRVPPGGISCPKGTSAFPPSGPTRPRRLRRRFWGALERVRGAQGERSGRKPGPAARLRLLSEPSRIVWERREA